MVNSADDESDSLTLPPEQVAEFAWEEFEEFSICNKEQPEPKKAGVIKAVFKYIGRSKPTERVNDNSN